jgi:hypothetical protein
MQSIESFPIFSASYVEGWEEGGDDAKSAWPSDTLGYTRVTIASTTGRNIDKAEQTLIKDAPVRIEVCNSTS